MQCTKCHSDDVRKFSIVYEEGTSIGKSEGSSDNAGYSLAEHFSQTPLAKRCSPPPEPTVGFILGSVGLILSAFVALEAGFFLGSFLWGIGTFFASLFVLYFFWRNILAKRAFSGYEKKMESWNRSWVCLKCGNTFEEAAER
jgi:hypothetical protein